MNISLVRVVNLAMFGLAIELGACSRAASKSSPIASTSPEITTTVPAEAEAKELPFVEDDYPRALQLAMREKKLVFVDTWATWCHSCLSLKAFVFSDARVLKHSRDVVWLSVDVDKKENEPFLRTFSPTALPTLWLIDPGSETVKQRWVGSLDAEQLVRLISRPDAAKGPDARAADLLDAKKFAECIDLVRSERAKMPNGPGLLNLLSTGVECERELGPAKRTEFSALLSELRALTNDYALPLVADDRSSAYEVIVDALRELKDDVSRRDEAGHWAIFLEEEAQKAKTPAARAVFDAHRLLAYTEISAIDRAIPMLLASERDFPKDFNPPARLARAYLALARPEEALAAADRALALAYGPRKIKIYALKADTLHAVGTILQEKQTLREATSFARTVDLSPAYRSYVEGLEARKKALR